MADLQARTFVPSLTSGVLLFYCFFCSSKILTMLAQTVLGDCAASTPDQICSTGRVSSSARGKFLSEVRRTYALLLVVLGDGAGLLVVSGETLVEGLGGVV